MEQYPQNSNEYEEVNQSVCIQRDVGMSERERMYEEQVPLDNLTSVFSTLE